MHKLIPLFTILLVIGCGGGGSGGSSNVPPPNPTPPPSIGAITPIITSGNIEVYGQTEAENGESIGFAILSTTTSDVQVRWSQTEGEPLELLATNSQTLGFTPSIAGNYQLQADVSVNGQSQSVFVDFTVNPSTKDFTVMLDHSVSELDNVSLHAYNGRSVAISDIRWTQIAGPSIAQSNQQDQFFFFDAPEVNSDSLVVFEVEAEYSDGITVTEQVQILINNVNYNRTGLFYSNDFFITEDMHAYRQDSPYKNALESCVYDNNIPSTPNCDFNQLPLIGMDTSTPSIDSILDRTLVSHPWMGKRFEEFLRNSSTSEDMRLLLRGVNAIVISYEVRPSFYWAATGAIYLDANNFWVTPAERDTLNDRPDFRSDFGDELSFLYFWRYTKDNDYYPAGRYPKNERQARTFADLEGSISWLMYHELAHANDFFPPTSWAGISRNLTPLEYFRASGANSDGLDSRYPLTSAQMHALAEVRYGGQTPTSTQRNYTATQVSNFFTSDIAPSFYAYYTIREDFATLFERFMMSYRLDASADIAFLAANNNDNFLVTWGQRNRIADPALADRTQYVLERVYPELGSASSLIATLPQPELFPVNQPWFETLDFSQSGNTGQPSTNLSKRDIAYRLAQDSKPQHIHKPMIIPNQDTVSQKE